MALPPEPLSEVLPEAVWVVEAEVLEILSMGPQVPKVEAPLGTADTGQKVRQQTVKLSIKRVLKGSGKPKELVVDKPQSAYGLRAGNKGAFLLDSSKPNPKILGRYGPDTWRLASVEAALKKAP